MAQTREQNRMAQTWQALTTRFGSDPEQWRTKSTASAAKAYMSALKKTPARIYTSGLGQALAFLKSRDGAEATNALEDLSALTLRLLLPRVPGQVPPTDLLAFLRNADTTFYFLATEEALAVCLWLTRYLAGAGIRADEGTADEASTTDPETLATVSPAAAGGAA